jgi:hypothetical protein
MASYNVRLHGLPVDTDEDRGKFLLTAHSEIVNNGTSKVEEAFRDLLESGAWRSYTFPDGTHHTWLEREFDYFVSSWLASQDDQRWESVRRNLVSRDVIMAMADHSGGPVARNERRSIDDVREQFPGVGVEPIQMVSIRERTVALDADKRRAYLADETVTPHKLIVRARRWIVHHTGDTDLAEAIVAKLQQDPDLVASVYRKLHAQVVSQSRRRNSS